MESGEEGTSKSMDQVRDYFMLFNNSLIYIIILALFIFLILSRLIRFLFALVS